MSTLISRTSWALRNAILKGSWTALNPVFSFQVIDTETEEQSGPRGKKQDTGKGRDRWNFHISRCFLLVPSTRTKCVKDLQGKKVFCLEPTDCHRSLLSLPVPSRRRFITLLQLWHQPARVSCFAWLTEASNREATGSILARGLPRWSSRQLHNVRKHLLSSLVGENLCSDSVLLSLSFWMLCNSWIHQIHDPWLTHSPYEHGSGFHDKVPWSRDNYLPKVSDGEPRYKQTPKLLTFITLKSSQWKSSPHQIRNVSQDFNVVSCSL